MHEYEDSHSKQSHFKMTTQLTRTQKGEVGGGRGVKLNQAQTYLSRQLVYGAATKLFHPCLSLASLWRVPQLWFIVFISAATVLRRIVFGRPRFRFPSKVQWIATLVMESASLHGTCPIQRHHSLMMMVTISSCWHRAVRSRLEMVLSQMCWIFLRLVL